MGNIDRVGDVRQVLRKFPRSDFNVDLLREWGYLSKAESKQCFDGEAKLTKTDIIRSISETYSGKKVTAGDEAVGNLDLIHVQRYSRRKLWSVYELKKVRDVRQPQVPSAKFAKKLQKELLNYFLKAVVCMREKDEIYWMRIEVREKPVKRQLPQAASQPGTMVTFVVYYPNTDYLFVSGLRVSVAPTFMQAFLRVLSCKEANLKQLQGHCVASLAELAIYRQSQGSFKKFRKGSVEGNPLIRGRKRKKDVEEEELDDNITYENIDMKTQRQKVLDDNFGTEELPNLEKLDYKLETPFHGSEFAPRMRQHKDIFRCRVKFEGTNVLEGLRQLGEAGLTKIPLPSHIGKVHCQGRNVFVLKQ